MWASLLAFLKTLQGLQSSGHRPLSTSYVHAHGVLTMIHVVFSDGTSLSLSAPEAVVAVASGEKTPKAAPSPPPPLNERILEVLARQAGPVKQRTICNELGLKPKSSYVAAGVAELVRAGKVQVHAGYKYSRAD